MTKNAKTKLQLASGFALAFVIALLLWSGETPAECFSRELLAVPVDAQKIKNSYDPEKEPGRLISFLQSRLEKKTQDEVLAAAKVWLVAMRSSGPADLFEDRVYLQAISDKCGLNFEELR